VNRLHPRDRRPLRLALLLAVALGVTGCQDKAELILEEATALYEAGDPGAAAQTLRRMHTETPAAPQVSTAALLATRWLTEAAEAAETDEERRRLYRAALDWEPDHARVWSALCRIEFDAQRWEDARACVEEGRDFLPPDRLEGYTGRIARHDEEVALAAERARLLDANTLESWDELVKLFPDSDEASAARELIVRRSLCREIDRFIEPLKLIGPRSPRTWGERVRKESERSAQVTILTQVRDEARIFTGEMADVKGDLVNHGLIEGEDAVRDGLVAAYTLLEPHLSQLDAAYNRRKYKLEDRLAAVERFDMELGRAWPSLKDARKAADRGCVELAEQRELEKLAEEGANP